MTVTQTDFVTIVPSPQHFDSRKVVWKKCKTKTVWDFSSRDTKHSSNGVISFPESVNKMNAFEGLSSKYKDEIVSLLFENPTETRL